MNFMQAVKVGFQKYATFSGRAARSEYWNWVLFSVIVSFVTSLLDNIFFNAPMGDHNAFHPINGIFMLILLIPSLAVAVRRLHDVNRSGWWILISLTIVGIFFPLLYWYCSKGTETTNRFGDDPLK